MVCVPVAMCAGEAPGGEEHHVHAEHPQPGRGLAQGQRCQGPAGDLQETGTAFRRCLLVS